MSEQRNFLSNDSDGTTPSRQFFSAGKQGDVTADIALMPLLPVVPYAGTIVNVWGANETNGTDATADALTMAFKVFKNLTTAVCTTDPALSKTAGTARKSTYGTGTGITQAVIAVDGSQRVAAGDSLSVTFDITRAGTPSVEINGPMVTVEIIWDAVPKT